MLFAIYCVDKPESSAVRRSNRQHHIAYLSGFQDQIVTAGPLLMDDRTTPCGSLLILDFPDIASAEAFVAGDPYAKAGLFAEVSIRPFRQTLP